MMNSVFYGESAREWTDMSNYVVHFTRTYNGKRPARNIVEILKGKRIEARNCFGIGREKAPQRESQRVVCFSEVPLAELHRVASRRSSEYGIGFEKSIAVMKGTNPILYAYKDGPAVSALSELMSRAVDENDDPIWKLAPFVDMPGQFGTTTYFFEWEREWRKVGDFIFGSGEIAFLIAPEKAHEAIERVFRNWRKGRTGIGYDCPLVDVSWRQARINRLLDDLI
jgi:hypothetical protein